MRYGLYLIDGENYRITPINPSKSLTWLFFGAFVWAFVITWDIAFPQGIKGGLCLFEGIISFFALSIICYINLAGSVYNSPRRVVTITFIHAVKKQSWYTFVIYKFTSFIYWCSPKKILRQDAALLFFALEQYQQKKLGKEKRGIREFQLRYVDKFVKYPLTQKTKKRYAYELSQEGKNLWNKWLNQYS